MGALDLRGTVAILIAITGVILAVGSANAETAALAEREGSETADSRIRDATPNAEKLEERLERRERRSQRGKERLARARVVLFEGIELSAEQTREVDALVEAEMEYATRIDELRAELVAARQQSDKERIRAINKERRSLLRQRKGPDTTMEEMRALLKEEQRPTFDMNRARLAAENQQPQNKRRKKNPRAGAMLGPE